MCIECSENLFFIGPRGKLYICTNLSFLCKIHIHNTHARAHISENINSSCFGSVILSAFYHFTILHTKLQKSHVHNLLSKLLQRTSTECYTIIITIMWHFVKKHKKCTNFCSVKWLLMKAGANLSCSSRISGSLHCHRMNPHFKCPNKHFHYYF